MSGYVGRTLIVHSLLNYVTLKFFKVDLKESVAGHIWSSTSVNGFTVGRILLQVHYGCQLTT